MAVQGAALHSIPQFNTPQLTICRVSASGARFPCFGMSFIGSKEVLVVPTIPQRISSSAAAPTSKRDLCRASRQAARGKPISMSCAWARAWIRALA